MEDNEKHYGLSPAHFLKNVVYRNSQGDLIIAVTRGDLDVNDVKLGKVAKQLGDLEPATEEDLKAIGTKTGWVHSWGHSFVEPRKAATEDRTCEVIYVADEALKVSRNLIGGQKEATTDTKNVNYGRDFTCAFEGDIAEPVAGMCALDGSPLEEGKGIEVGNIFQLGYHYSSKMKGAEFVDNDGKTKPYYMGCYGIGVGRTMATIVEQYHDERGVCWPEQIAPYRVVLIAIGKGEEFTAQADALYAQLQEAGIEVLYDDRSQSPGVKFADADLIGIPHRIVLSQKTIDQGGVEYKQRTQADATICSIEDVLARLTS